MKNYLIYCFAVILLLMGCNTEDSTPTTGNAASAAAAAATDSPGKIPLGKRKAAAVIYNPAANELVCLCRQKQTYSLYYLETDDIWSTCQTQWTVKKGVTLDNFSFNAAGALYATEKKPRGKKKLSQNLVRLYNNGKRKKVNLQNLDKIPQEIKDLQFDDNTAAITFSNKKVKFYNIKEGAALGADITGAPGKNAFYDKKYITACWDQSRGLYILDFTDIQFGESTRTLALKPAANSDMYFIAHYRENLYFLCGDGIYGGAMNGKNLPLIIDYASLELPSSSRLTALIAARDNELYIVWLDEEKHLHLQRCIGA